MKGREKVKQADRWPWEGKKGKRKAKENKFRIDSNRSPWTSYSKQGLLTPLPWHSL